MAVKSLARSSILQPQETRFALAGYQTNMFHHLETIRLSSSASSVEFTNLGQYSDYQHLQIRYAARSDRASFSLDPMNMRFNGDTGNNYSYHHLEGNGSSVASYPEANTSRIYAIASSSTAPTSAFGAGIIELLDPYETTKYTTARVLNGTTGGSNISARLSSGSWRNTDALTAVSFSPVSGLNLLTGSRFSLYGLKVRA